MEQEYFLGLDLGTGSLGWAVTNNQYEILRAHGKALWGVRLFNNAHTAEERRTFRTSRRRLARRNWRVELLQGIFAEQINEVDSGFFLRMKESRYTSEDKREANGQCPVLPYALFVDADYTDKEYHQQFPTIYHLRKWLMETEKTPDIRLVYLALHHMMKHRGHFLFSGSIENVRDFGNIFRQLIQSLYNEELDFTVSIDDEKIEEIEVVLKNNHLVKSEKRKKIVQLLGAHNSCEKALCNLLVGGIMKLSDLFGNSELDQSEKPKISFVDNQYDEYATSLETILGEQYNIIAKAKAVYDWAVLADILGSHTSISEAKVAVYEKHKQDLAYLKHLIKRNLGRDVYQEVFIKTQDKLANYPAYIGMTKENGRKCAMVGKQCTQADFYTFLRKTVLQVISDKSQAAYLQAELEKETFLPKQVTKENGVIPHQVHLFELNQIINHLKERVPLLAEWEEQLHQIFTFRIPYYVGPLNGIVNGDKTTNWVQRKSHNKIYPWNFEETVDIEASAEEFIRRMTNKCTYLICEDVLPKHSLLYSKFVVLNELNNLRLDGEPISVALKQKIYTELFQHSRNVTQKKLQAYLIREGVIDKQGTVAITGIDGDFKGSLAAYHDLKEKLTGCTLTEKEKETIILNITLFGNDKTLLKKRLQKLYPQLSEPQCNSLCTLSYQGWGRLSEVFLEGVPGPASETGEVWTIIRALWETNDNLMQILSEKKYQFAKAIADKNGKNENRTISYQLVEELYVSPAVKRQIWQTLQIVKELCNIMENPPKRVFVEMAREKAESKRTDSRKKKLMDLYKKCKEEEQEWIAALEHTDEQALRSDKLYLYYTQKGRCMYTGEVIPLEDLWNNQIYDIDHIYPQSKTMDDSLNNRVLVKKTANADKGDQYPIKEGIRKARKSFWKSLLDGGFIEKEKYNRLTRATEFELNELSGFIDRQLVETRQGTKAVASLLQQVLPDTEIVYVKAKIVSQFRQDFDLLKVREMNDLHHAKDAYLNIVVGNTYYTKFTKDPVWFLQAHPGRSYNLKKMFTSEQDVVRKGEIAWQAGEGGTIHTVKKVMNKNNILVTRKAYQVQGGLFDQQPLKKGKGQVPIKGSDERLCSLEKYGGYNGVTGSYFMLVASEDKKGNPIKTIEYVPLYLCVQLEQSEENVIAYLTKERELKNPQILLAKIKIDTLFKVDGFHMWLSGRSGSQLIFKGANQLILPSTEERTLKKVLKFVERTKDNKSLKLVKQDSLEQESLLNLYNAFLIKLQTTIYQVRLATQGEALAAKRDKFLQLEKEEQCLVLAEILHLFQCQSGSANLKSIGGPANAGILQLNHNITKSKQISIINQSPTGIYEQEIDLLSL